MIALLTGKFLHKSPTQLIVDAGGVGYLVSISLHTYAAIETKDSGSLFIHTKVSEDAIALFGFATPDEMGIFEKLIGVNGVGANTARMMLSHMKPDELRQAIIQGQAGQLERIKGIGKKTAERIILELRDKMGVDKTAFANTNTHQGNSAEQDALDALVALGIPRPTAITAIKKLQYSANTPPTVEMIIKQVLKTL